MTLFDTVFRTSRAEQNREPRSSTFAPELLLMLFLVFAPILAMHAAAWIIGSHPPVESSSARLASGDKPRGG
jgi:hypothetical protein